MTREEIIKKNFTEIKLNQEQFDLYTVRTAILRAVNENIDKFHGKILDVGCGIMPYRELIKEKNKRVTSYLGLDFETAIYPEYDLGKPDLLWDGNSIPLDNKVIDTVIATEFFEHVPDPEKIMKEIFRVLKPGGVIFFTVPFIWYLHIVPFDEYRYTPFSFKRHLQNSGFINIDIKTLGSWDASLAQMIAIWYQQRPLSKKRKKLFYPVFYRIIKKLLKTDNKFLNRVEFRDGDMITGLYGSAYKL